MNKEYYRGLRSESICDVINAPKRAHKLLGTLNVSGTNEPIEQHRMTLAMSRDPRRNALQSAALAMQIAERNQDVSVVYFNTYAGRELMRESFQSVSASPNPSLREGNNLDSPTKENESSPLPKEGCSQLPNLHILNIPFGEWNLADIIRTLRPNSSEPSALDKPLVIIVNDFELAGFTAWNRRCVARDLIQLKEQTCATVIVFSHEMREELKAGLPGRGALGLIAIKSDAVHRLPSEFDHLIKTRHSSKNEGVHEAQTKVIESEPEYKLTRNSLEGGEDLVAAGFSLRHSGGNGLSGAPIFPAPRSRKAAASNE
jgi:hypothetical protein